MREGRTRGGGERGEIEQNRDKQREREGLIDKEGRWERANPPQSVEKQEPKLCPNSDVYFIWGGRCAGSTTSHAALARSRLLCGSPRDKTVMKPDGNNTDHQRKPSARQPDPLPTLLSRPFVSRHKFAPSSLSCWLCLFRDCRWRKISCTDSHWVVKPLEAPCLSYHTDCFKRGSSSSEARCGLSKLNDPVSSASFKANKRHLGSLDVIHSFEGLKV